MDHPALPERRSARLLIVDPQGRLLLFRYHDEHKDPFWATPGGELVGDETFDAVAARELLEETGQRLPIGEVLRERTDVYAVARSGPARWHERYFLVRAPAAFTPVRDGWTDEEQETIIDHRWWTADQLLKASKSLKPRCWPSWRWRRAIPREYHETVDESGTTQPFTTQLFRHRHRSRSTGRRIRTLYGVKPRSPKKRAASSLNVQWSRPRGATAGPGIT